MKQASVVERPQFLSYGSLIADKSILQFDFSSDEDEETKPELQTGMRITFKVCNMILKS